jgi:hypothetical protein
MVGVLGLAPKPSQVWEEQFDGHNRELAELAQMDWDKVPDEHFWYYFHDLAYVDLQADLFRHMFPACLKYWYETFMRDTDTSRGDAEFHYGLAQGRIIEKMLSEPERRRLHDFFRDGYLDRIGIQDAFPRSGKEQSAHGWIFRLNSLAMVAPIVGEIWEAWWMLDSTGKAYCAAMYASGLVYATGENPLYGAWTPLDGEVGRTSGRLTARFTIGLGWKRISCSFGVPLQPATSSTGSNMPRGFSSGPLERKWPRRLHLTRGKILPLSTSG